MAIDWDAFLIDQYDTFGLEAVLDLGTTGSFDITVIDKTEGVLLEAGHGLSLATSKPAVCVRVAQLIDLGFSENTGLDAVKGGTLTLGGHDWKIVSTQPKPKPGNPNAELYLILQGA